MVKNKEHIGTRYVRRALLTSGVTTIHADLAAVL